MTSHVDMSDAALLTLVGRLDPDALGELFRRYGTVVLAAAGWTEQTAVDAEQTAVDVFLDVWRRPAAYVPGVVSTASHLARAAIGGEADDAVRPAAARLANLDGWTYHDVAEALSRPRGQVARLIREQLAVVRRASLE